MSRVLCALLACAAAFMAACFGPALDGFACGPDRECPKGYECSANNMCVPPGTNPGIEPDANVVPVDPRDANVGPAPAAIVVFPLPVGMTEAGSVTVRGTAAHEGPILGVRVNGVAAASANGFLDWTVEVPLDLGPNVLRVETEDELGNIDPDAASVSVLRTSPLVFDPGAITMNPAGNQAVVADVLTDALLAVDLTTGERTVIADDNTGLGGDFVRLGRLAVNAAGDTVFAVDVQQATVVAIDIATGDRAVLSGNGAGAGEDMQFPFGLALDEVNRHVLVGDDGSGMLLAVDMDNGSRTVLSGVDSGGTPHGQGPDLGAIAAIAFDAQDNRVLVADPELPALLAVDLATGDRGILSGQNAGSGPPLLFPVGVTLGANAGEAFVADAGRGAIVHVDLATGNRAVVSGTLTGSGVPLSDLEDLAMHPDGQRVFVVDDGHLVPLVVDVVTGARSLVAAGSVGSGPALGDPEGVVLDAARGRLLIPDDDLDGVLAVELGTGNRTLLGDDTDVSLVDPEAIALDPAGNRAVVLDSTLDACVAVDLATGARTVLSSDAFGGGPPMSDPQAVVLDEAGTTALVTDAGRLAVLSVDLVTAERLFVTSNNVQTGIPLDFPDAIILDRARNRVLVADSGSPALIAVDLTTGVRTRVGILGAGPEIAVPLGMTPIGPDTALVYDDDTGVYVILDLATDQRIPFGTAELRGGVPFGSPHIMFVDATRNVLLIADEALRAVIAVDMTTSERLIVSR
jgi:DNA-binding beta-propeller fold protein YncE